MIINRIYKSELIGWQGVKDLQPKSLKVHTNKQAIKDSILKHGISKAYDVCEIGGVLYWLDGHTRTDVLNELVADGVDIPEKLMANFCEVKNKQEAVKILLEVHNQKLNKISNEVLTEWLEVENINLSEIDVSSLNVEVIYNPDNIDLDSFFEEDNSEKINKNKIVLEYTDEDFELVNEALKNHTGSKEQIFFKLLGL